MNLALYFIGKFIKKVVLMIKARSRRKLISDINVVPYIDVMLVLLVVFMISAPLMVQGVLVNLPEVSSEALPRKVADPLIVSVDIEGRYYLEIGAMSEQSLNLKELATSVSKILEVNPGQQIVVRGDGEVKYESIMIMMSELQSLGAKEVGLITKPLSKIE